MIRQIGEIFDLNKIPNGHYGRRIKAWFSAYGLKYDFCRFYEIRQESAFGYAAILNSSAVIAVEGNGFDAEEFEFFIMSGGAQSVEMPRILAERLKVPGYRPIERIFFYFAPGEYPKDMAVEKNPRLDEVFDILKQGFPIEDNYALWLTETSHRIRHGISRIYLYKDTTAELCFKVDGYAFFGQIATSLQSRGKGQARELLYWLENRMSALGIKPYFCAKPERESFYRSLGFCEFDRDIVLEHI
ncbi:MAG TPA: hypothetical protein PLM59_09360 [Oscillospiraceae bacterium]|nr:hypothetical protein [Oscillospiraceae bacterium]